MEEYYYLYDTTVRGKIAEATFDDAVREGRLLLKRTPTEGGFVSPACIFHYGVLIAVLSDDANGITVHKLKPGI